MSLYIIITMLVTLFAKLFGFAREIVLSYFFGADQISDAYLISLTIPGTIFQFVGTGLATSFIPIYIKSKNKANQGSSEKFTNTVATAVLLFATVATVVVWVLGDKVVLLFASGFSGETLRIATLFTKINISSLYLATFIYVFSSYLQANEKVLAVQLSVIPYSLTLLFSIVLAAKIHILILPIGSIVASAVQLITLLYFIFKLKYKFYFSFDFKMEEFADLCKIIVPVIVGVSINDINILVDRTMASNIATGAISALAYSYSLTMFIQGVFVQSITSIYYPKISKAAVENDRKSFIRFNNEGILAILFFLFPISVYCFVSSKNVINLLYGRGAFNNEAVGLTSMAFLGYALSFIGVGLREFLSRIYYSMQNTKIPTINAGIGGILNVILNIVLSRLFGIFGLALATSISAIVTSILLYVSLYKTSVFYFSRDFFVQSLKILIASIVMLFAILSFRRFCFSWSVFILFFAEVLIGVLIYLLMCLLLKIQVISVIKQNLLKKFVK